MLKSIVEALNEKEFYYKGELYYGSGVATYKIETDYGSDADGNRGAERVIDIDVMIESILDDEYVEIEITEEIADAFKESIG